MIAIEVIEQSAAQGRERSAALGLNVEVLHAEATGVSLETRAGLCIAELVGAIGGAEGIAAVIDDARKRHLDPGAAVIPHRVRTMVSAAGVSALLGAAPALDVAALPYLEQIWRTVGGAFDTRLCMTGLAHGDLATTIGDLEDLELGAGRETHADRVMLIVQQPGTIDSLVLWLRLQCAPDQPTLDSLETVTNWMPVLAPFDVPAPIAVQPGDRLELEVHRTTPDGLHPAWTFDGIVRRGSGDSPRITATSPYADGPIGASWLHRALFRVDPAEAARSRS